MCECCINGTFVKNDIEYSDYKFCPECGRNLNVDFWLFGLTKNGNVVDEEKMTLKKFHNMIKEKNLKIKHYYDRPTNDELKFFDVGDIIYCENRCAAFVICT